ncbi:MULTISPECIES: hypothetical protein [unclassified Phenylobacterium]|uniref:hypothetical protein n=1 Tax=unclassified Phenylobacterium TaxID=2640670 RepID=UPI000A950173|nr:MULTISPECIES: hypothetical protein [unclassified Phenylobacterium]
MRRIWRSFTMAAAVALLAFGSAAATPEPATHDYVIRDFRFRRGETLAELKIRYTPWARRRPTPQAR